MDYKEYKELEETLLGKRSEDTNTDKSLVDIINECCDINDRTHLNCKNAEMNNLENNAERESKQSEVPSSIMVAYVTIEEDKTKICFYDHSFEKRVFEELQIYKLPLVTYITTHPNHYISIAFIAESNNAIVDFDKDKVILTHMLRLHKTNEES